MNVFYNPNKFNANNLNGKLNNIKDSKYQQQLKDDHQWIEDIIKKINEISVGNLIQYKKKKDLLKSLLETYKKKEDLLKFLLETLGKKIIDISDGNYKDFPLSIWVSNNLIQKHPDLFKQFDSTAKNIKNIKFKNDENDKKKLQFLLALITMINENLPNYNNDNKDKITYDMKKFPDIDPKIQNDMKNFPDIDPKIQNEINRIYIIDILNRIKCMEVIKDLNEEITKKEDEITINKKNKELTNVLIKNYEDQKTINQKHMQIFFLIDIKTDRNGLIKTYINKRNTSIKTISTIMNNYQTGCDWQFLYNKVTYHINHIITCQNEIKKILSDGNIDEDISAVSKAPENNDEFLKKSGNILSRYIKKMEEEREVYKSILSQEDSGVIKKETKVLDNPNAELFKNEIEPFIKRFNENRNNVLKVASFAIEFIIRNGQKPLTLDEIMIVIYTAFSLISNGKDSNVLRHIFDNIKGMSPPTVKIFDIKFGKY